MPSSGVQTCALRSEEHTSELQSHDNLVCRLLLEKKTPAKHPHPAPPARLLPHPRPPAPPPRVPRFYRGTFGNVTLDEVDVRHVKLASLRRQIGVISQDPFLFSATVRENITFGAPDLDEAEVERIAPLAQAHEFIEKLPARYDTVIGERGITLSGGQRQRL